MNHNNTKIQYRPGAPEQPTHGQMRRDTDLTGIQACGGLLGLLIVLASSMFTVWLVYKLATAVFS